MTTTERRAIINELELNADTKATIKTIEAIDKSEIKTVALYIKLIEELLSGNIDDDKLKEYTKKVYSTSWSKKINGLIGGVVKYSNQINMGEIKKLNTVTEIMSYIRALKPSNKQQNEGETSETSEKREAVKNPPLNGTEELKGMKKEELIGMINAELNRLHQSSLKMSVNELKLLIVSLKQL